MKMYKLFVTRVTKQISPHGVSFIPKQVIVQRSMRLCSYCNFYHGKISKCHSPIKKKGKQRTKKYTELLAVTNETASNKRTEVKKLTDLSILVDHSNITTDSLYDTKSPVVHQTSDSKYMEDDYHNYLYDNEIHSNIRNYPNVLADDEIKCDKLREHENEFVNPNKVKKSNDAIIQETSNSLFDTKKTKKNKKPESSMDKSSDFYKTKNKYNMQNYVESLLVHMQIYLSCGLMNRANNTLMKYRKHAQNNLKSCNQVIELYNVLLEAYASKRKTTKVLELYDLIKKDSLKPTPQTYAYIFDAFGREKLGNNQLELLNKLKDEMNNYNISFNDIIIKSFFKIEQQENVLKTISMLQPNFKPSYPELSTKYMCKILRQAPIKSNYESPAKELLTIEELRDLSKIQFQSECMIEVKIPSICNDSENNDAKTSAMNEKIMEVEDCWKKAATTAFDRNVKCLKQKELQSHNNLMVLYPFFEVLAKEHYVNAMLREIKQLAGGSETYSTSLKFLHIGLGKYIYKTYEMEMKKRTGVLDEMINVYSKYLEWYLQPESMPHLSNMNNRTVWQYFEREEIKNGTSLNIMCLNWPIDVIINVGKFLYNIILNDIILPPDILKGQDLKHSIPAFYTLFRNKGTYLSEQIKPHPFVSKLYKESHLETLTFDSLVLPTYAPPNPWISIYSGGYLVTKTSFIRIPDYTDRPWRLLQNTPSEQLFPILDSLNQLSSIPWKINTAILDIITKIFQKGGSVELNVPQSIAVLSPPPAISKTATVEEKQKAAIATARYKQKKYEMFALWCDALYKLSIANHFRNKIFWLPHNLDFRGRVYPVPPHLNHLSSDLGRSLLLFAKGKRLGPNGLDWLKLHVVNLTNFKKGTSVQERIEFANENLDNILDSANQPLTGKMWWARSEEPWQTLAGCMEIANALKAPNVEEYVGTFPIHQDGSCNGLQHYAALGRDQIGAESVNLYPFDTPRDVYTAVASVVENQRKIDSSNDHKLAQVLEGFVKRKVIKQTVMTTVYGVTKYGAKHQFNNQLADTANFPEEYIWPASLYLTENTFHSLRTMFKSAREIQDWFTECARIISSICYDNVEWITPLGLPIVQPYMKQPKFHRKGHIKGNEKPDVMKQRNAFAPNFIHSLDSTHMMLTSLHCNQENVTFVSVHDCFWTHPCTVDIMNKICREQFVALHSESILEDLAKFFVERYLPVYENLKTEKQNNTEEIRKCLTNVPLKGTFDINNVLLST
ncbi:DNA-directed RNA polymerase, mitochondrial, partial [Ceratina calcarata]|uniref:DNA-directed RNA polymerase n=1 Tax=Ceratina calcarata TaxID=156304 RepID=A0AAJ7S120_9HYME